MIHITGERLSSVLPELLSISLEAGQAILQVYDSDFAVEQKDDKSPLTLADKHSHEIIARRVSSLPGCLLPLLSEEGRHMPYEERKAWNTFWLVDPLDGTKEFVKRNGEFTVNIALIQSGRPLLGVIYLPVKNIFYFAAEGLGSFKLEQSNMLSSGSLDMILSSSIRLPIAPCPLPLANRVTVIGSRSHMSPETEQFINDLKTKYKEVDFLAAGSSLKFCLIAEGKADVYPRFGPTMEWDTAAGQAIVEQAGGRVLRAGSQEPLSYNKENLLNPSFIVTTHVV
ncbi:MAG: 3'(2'),5'-bisphosphate nucleotidase CysQ [Nitrospirota bacterium]|nr:3'(2'),5'-bisphosphate nucleotidase CysQ [Nitrospirota bacterium]